MKRGKRAVFAVAVLLVASVLAVTGCKNAAGDSGGQQGGGGLPFWISDHEVTQAEWAAVFGQADVNAKITSDTYGKGNDYPMYNVSWYDALVYCNKLSISERRTPCYTIDGKQILMSGVMCRQVPMPNGTECR